MVNVNRLDGQLAQCSISSSYAVKSVILAIDDRWTFVILETLSKLKIESVDFFNSLPEKIDVKDTMGHFQFSNE